MEGSWECGAFGPKVIQEGVNLGNSSPQTELGAGSKEGLMEVDVAPLEEGKEGTYLLLVGNVFDKGNEGILHGHVVVGVGFAKEADRGLGIDGTVKGRC